MVPLAHRAEHALVQMNGHEEGVVVEAIGTATADTTSSWSMVMVLVRSGGECVDGVWSVCGCDGVFMVFFPPKK
jgi:hypothetical protein